MGSLFERLQSGKLILKDYKVGSFFERLQSGKLIFNLLITNTTRQDKSFFFS